MAVERTLSRGYMNNFSDAVQVSWLIGCRWLWLSAARGTLGRGSCDPESVWFVISPYDCDWAPRKYLKRSRVGMCVVALMSDAPYSRLGHAGYIPALTVILSYLVCSSPDVRTWLLRSLFSGLCLSTAFSMKPFLTTLSKMTRAFTHSLTCSSSLLYLSL